MKRPASRWSRWLARAATATALLVVVPNVALAAGTVSPAKTDLTEAAGGWKVFLTVKLGKKPANPHQSFRFVFKRTVLYETFLDDAHGDKEQTRNIPTPDADPMVESMDVNFANAKGEIWETTKLDFVIRRDRGFEAGEYKVEVRDSDNRAVGSTFTLKLGGQNAVVDRRAMVMADPGKKKKKEEKKEEPKEEPKADPTEKKDDAAPAEPKKDGEGDGAQPPPPVEKKSGGCGCTVPDGETTGFAIPLAAAGLAAVALRRRRRLGAISFQPSAFSQSRCGEQPSAISGRLKRSPSQVWELKAESRLPRTWPSWVARSTHGA